MIMHLLIALALVAGCKSTSQSQVAASTVISESEILDLTKYKATAEDYAKFRTELGTQYERQLQQLTEARKQTGRQIPKIFDSLTEEEAVAIYHYSSMGYRTLNAVLRKADIANTAKQAGFIKVLSSALNKLPAVQATVYRGGMLPAFGNGDYFSPFHSIKTVDPDRLARFKVGQIFVDKGFMSTSLHNPDGIRQAFGCREALYTIHGNYGREISALAVIPNEREILFIPGSEFRIEKINNTYPPENKCNNEVIEIEATEVEPGTYKDEAQ
ncbi:MAG: hypothetical protein FJ146_00120 [Deltaproteobacteria bacterium]|nr:hypothetical protein [Deltaproteobacteria bacterium]